jgi:hypothetical protein
MYAHMQGGLIVGGTDTQITAYLLVPDPSLSERAAKLELETAVRYLAHETNASQQRKVARINLFKREGSADR